MKEEKFDINGSTLRLMQARSFGERLRGLLGYKSLPKSRGLLIPKCNSVHMFGMRMSLDIIFLNKDYQVVKLVEKLKPWRVSFCVKSSHVIEVASGEIMRMGIEVGQELRSSN